MNKVIFLIIYFFNFASSSLSSPSLSSHSLSSPNLNNRQIIPFNVLKNSIVNLDNSTIILRNASNASNARVMPKDLYLNRRSKFCHIKCGCFFSHDTRNEKYEKYESMRWTI